MVELRTELAKEREDLMKRMEAVRKYLKPGGLETEQEQNREIIGEQLMGMGMYLDCLNKRLKYIDRIN